MPSPSHEVINIKTMARVFDSTSKKLSIPLFVLFEIGWSVFTAGFVLLLLLRKKDDSMTGLLFDNLGCRIRKSSVCSILHYSTWWAVSCSTGTPSCFSTIGQIHQHHWCPVYFCEHNILFFSWVCDDFQLLL